MNLNIWCVNCYKFDSNLKYNKHLLTSAICYRFGVLFWIVKNNKKCILNVEDHIYQWSVIYIITCLFNDKMYFVIIILDWLICVSKS